MIHVSQTVHPFEKIGTLQESQAPQIRGEDPFQISKFPTTQKIKQKSNDSNLPNHALAKAFYCTVVIVVVENGDSRLHPNSDLQILKL